jgi:hypothetical protein
VSPTELSSGKEIENLMKKLLALTIVVSLIGLPLWAQEEEGQKARETVQEEGEQKTREMVKEEDSREPTEEEKLLRAIRLPEAAEEARQEGVPAEDVKKVLEAARSLDLPAGETETIMVEETKAVKEKGQIDNFGSFVESKLDEGLRGRELSEAIRTEHAARGKGKGHAKAGKQGAGRAGEAAEDEADDQRGKHGKKKGKLGMKKGKEELPPEGDN